MYTAAPLPSGHASDAWPAGDPMRTHVSAGANRSPSGP
jgi:hypothetical protein